MINIRPAVPTDIPEILAFIRELASLPKRESSKTWHAW